MDENYCYLPLQWNENKHWLANLSWECIQLAAHLLQFSTNTNLIELHKFWKNAHSSLPIGTDNGGWLLLPRELQTWEQALHQLIRQLKFVELGSFSFSFSETLLFGFACEIDVEAVRIMLCFGATPNGEVRIFRIGINTALCCAIEHGKLDVVKLLVESGAAVNLRSGILPLEAAITCGYFEIANFLLDLGLQSREFVLKLSEKGYRICLAALLQHALRHKNKWLITTLVSLYGHQLIPPITWVPLSPSPSLPPYDREIQIVVRITHPFPIPPSREVFFFNSNISARKMYTQVNLRFAKELELKWHDAWIYPGDQTLHDMGFKEREVLKDIRSTEQIEKDFLKKLPVIIHPMILCGIGSHPWLNECPYNMLPNMVKKSILSCLLIAKRQHWNVDKATMHKIIGYISFGWIVNE